MQLFSKYLITGMILGITFFLLFYNLAEDLLEKQLGYFDQTITTAITSIRSPLATQIMKLFTDMGSAGVITCIAAAAIIYLLFKKKHHWDAIMVAVSAGGASIMNYLLKLAFHRDRPVLPTLVQATGFSFPSGHTMVSIAFYGMLAFLLWVNFKREKRLYLIIFLLSLLVLTIGISRIYLGVHYPSDVLAGFAAGGFWLTGCILALQTVRLRLGR